MRRHITLAIALVVSLLACRDPNGAPDVASPYASEANSGLTAGGSNDASGIVGSVSGLTGVCPAVTFKLEGKTITTSAATRYDGGSCSDLKNGARIKVSGATQANGSVAAQAIGLAVPLTGRAQRAHHVDRGSEGHDQPGRRELPGRVVEARG